MKRALFWALYPFYVVVMIAIGIPYIIGYNCEKLMDILYGRFFSLLD